MIDKAKIDQEYYMSWSGDHKSGLYRIKPIAGLPSPNKGFYQIEIIDFYFDDTGGLKREGMANKADLYQTFEKALNRFMKATSYDQQDMIVNAFEDDGAMKRSMKRLSKRAKVI